MTKFNAKPPKLFYGYAWTHNIKKQTPIHGDYFLCIPGQDSVKMMNDSHMNVYIKSVDHVDQLIDCCVVLKAIFV